MQISKQKKNSEYLRAKCVVTRTQYKEQLRQEFIPAGDIKSLQLFQQLELYEKTYTEIHLR